MALAIFGHGLLPPPTNVQLVPTPTPLHSVHFKWRNPPYNFKQSLMSPLNGVNIRKTGLVWMACGQCNHEDHVLHTRTGHYNNYSEFSLANVLHTSTPALG